MDEVKRRGIFDCGFLQTFYDYFLITMMFLLLMPSCLCCARVSFIESSFIQGFFAVPAAVEFSLSSSFLITFTESSCVPDSITGAHVLGVVCRTGVYGDLDTTSVEESSRGGTCERIISRRTG